MPPIIGAAIRCITSDLVPDRKQARDEDTDCHAFGQHSFLANWLIEDCQCRALTSASASIADSRQRVRAAVLLERVAPAIGCKLAWSLRSRPHVGGFNPGRSTGRR